MPQIEALPRQTETKKELLTAEETKFYNDFLASIIEITEQDVDAFIAQAHPDIREALADELDTAKDAAELVDIRKKYRAAIVLGRLKFEDLNLIYAIARKLSFIPIVHQQLGSAIQLNSFIQQLSAADAA